MLKKRTHTAPASEGTKIFGTASQVNTTEHYQQKLWCGKTDVKISVLLKWYTRESGDPRKQVFHLLANLKRPSWEFLTECQKLRVADFFWKLTTASQSQTIKKSHHHTTLALLGDWHFRSPRVHASSDFRLIWASPSQTWVTVSSCRKWSTNQSTAIQENMIQLFEGGRHKSMRRNRQPLPRHTAQNSALHSCMTHLSVHMHITHTHTLPSLGDRIRPEGQMRTKIWMGLLSIMLL